jgi:hypothetical protein
MYNMLLHVPNDTHPIGYVLLVATGHHSQLFILNFHGPDGVRVHLHVVKTTHQIVSLHVSSRVFSR